MTLGETIARLRAERRMSQEALADAMGVSRQAVSKWETNGSVPDLDKLVKLGELFGVTLDELAKGAPAGAKRRETASHGALRQSEIPRERLVLGGVLLAVGLMGLLFLFLLAGLEGLKFGLMFLAPFVLSGLICMKARRHAGLWCAWGVYLPQQVYWTYATGLRWTAALRILTWTPEENYMRLVIAWVMLLAWVLLVIGTVRTFRKTSLPPGRRTWICLAAAWGMALLWPLLWQGLTAALYHMGKTISTAWVLALNIVPGAVWPAFLAAALALTAAALRGCRRKGPPIIC
ncbi:helix-turn-helix transcriptional regulator [uncultured Pseudoflavonifractor sp.]|uniref:helix-turn-helix domain-containing protein n=1 Tax=uncultured Pseudoflavonifractor sp. TaxID=1221379 RepID=UPI0025EC9E4F|nr:helix-turn-helix transcriptional regulator [uncultured Pseudoflavonifractor sp.]